MEPVKLRITSDAETSGFDKLNRALDGSKKHADEFIGSLKAGVGIDLGGRIVSSVAAIPGILQSMVGRGIAFNQTIKDSETAISNIIQRFAGLDAVAARGEAAKAIARIKELEPEAAGSLQDLVRGFLAVCASAAQAGIGVEQTAELTAKFANALSNANLPAEQLAQEMRAIFTGNITPDAALGKLLAISNEDIAKAKEAGNLAQMLADKIGTLGTAGDTAAVRASSLGSAIEQALGKLAEPATRALDQAIAELTEDIKKLPEAELKQFGSDLATLVGAGAGLTRWLMQHPALIVNIANAVGSLAAAWTAVKLVNLIAGLGAKAAALIAGNAALTAETAALAENSAAWSANAAAAGSAAAARTGAAVAGGAVAAGSAAVPAAAAGGAAAGRFFSLGGSGAGGALRWGAMTGVAAAIGFAVKSTIDSFTADTASQNDLQEQSTRNKMQASRKYGRPGVVPVRESNAEQPNPWEQPAPVGGATFSSEQRRDIEQAGLDGDALWAAKMERAEKLRGSLAGQLSIGQDFTPAEAMSAAEGTEGAGKEYLEEIGRQLSELLTLEKEIGGMQEDNAEHGRKSASEAEQRAQARNRELNDLRLEQLILQAQVRGDEKRTIELQAQRTERQTLQGLLDADVPADKAAEEAKRTAELQKQVSLKELAEKQSRAREQFADLKPSIGAEATARGGRGARQRREAESDFATRVEKGISDMGIDPASAEGQRLFSEKMDRYGVAMRDATGRGGGPATRSPLDQMGGFANLGVERESIATGPSDDWKKAFGERVQTSPNNAPETTTAKPSGGDGMQKAADGLDGAAGAQKSAAAKIEAAADKLSTTANTLAGAFANVSGALTNLDRRVAALEVASGQ